MYNEGMDERERNTQSADNQNESPERVELPYFEFGADEESKMESLASAIEQLPLEEQEPYWQIMDNDELEFGEKVSLINDLLKRYNGDIED